MKLNSISMLVILYDKTLEESQTLISLSVFSKKINNLVIVNNGPNKIDPSTNFFENLESKHNNVELINYIENKPLSWIYNEFIENYKDDYMVFLDDDTPLDEVFENKIFSTSDVDVELPKIFALSDNQQYYPIVNNSVYCNEGIIDNNNIIYSIGSGLIFSKKTIEIFKSKNIKPFDERFALYGVDTSFFRRLNLILREGADMVISSSTKLNHSLSRTEGKISEWRYIERLYDIVLSVKYYQNYKALRLLKIIIKNIHNLGFVKIILKTYYRGVHPRCEKKVEM